MSLHSVERLLAFIATQHYTSADGLIIIIIIINIVVYCPLSMRVKSKNRLWYDKVYNKTKF